MNEFSPNISVSDLLANLSNFSTQEVNYNFEDSFKALPKKQECKEEKPQRAQSKNSPLIRTDSLTGRPEEFYQTVKRKNNKSVTIVVENYQLGEKLGKGAFGVVYKGLDVKSGQFVAVKRIPRDKLNGESLHEISFLKTFNHPNIVSYRGLIRTEKHINLVLEFVDSGSLAQVLAGYGFFPETLAAIYVQQVLKGLDYLHNKGIIHRDIKGGNLLITREGVVKLADFGIATSVDSSTKDSLSEGSPYWMAPEVVEMTSSPTTASDIWSLGCTLIELLTGMPPYFDMEPLSAVYRMVKDDHPPLPSDLSPELENFLLQCFKRDASARPTASELLKHPWITMNSKDTVPVDDMRSTIKKYTIGKEGLKHIDISSIEWDPTPLDFSIESSRSNPNEKIRTSDSMMELSSQGIHDSMEMDDFNSVSDGNSTVRSKKKRGMSTLFRKKKDKKKSPNKIPTFDSALFAVNIYASETKRRKLFLLTINQIYKIKITNASKEWEIEKTWSDFKDFHDIISKELPNTRLPECPPKKFWGVMEPEFVKKRTKDLQEYTNQIIKIPHVRNSETFKHFLKENL